MTSRPPVQPLGALLKGALPGVAGVDVPQRTAEQRAEYAERAKITAAAEAREEATQMRLERLRAHRDPYFAASFSLPDVVAAWAARLGSGQYPGVLWLGGIYGAGKSTLIWDTAEAAVLAGWRGILDVANSGDVWETFSPPVDLEARRRYTTVDLLALDDMGRTGVSDWEKGHYWWVLDARIRRQLPTIIASNKDPKLVVDEATYSRLQQDWTYYWIPDKDHRYDTGEGLVTAGVAVADQGMVVDFTRELPIDLLAERAVLGGMMLSKDAIADVLAARLLPTDFHRPGHQLIAEAILHLYENDEPTDPVKVVGELTRRGDIGRMGGAPYLFTCVQQVPAAVNAGSYARDVRDLALLRNFISECTSGMQAGYEYARSGDREPEQIIEMFLNRIEAIITGRGASADDLEPFVELMQRIIGQIDPNKEDGGAPIVKVPTGFIDLDALLSGGLLGGEMIVIAGRPGSGKSTLAVDIARWLSIHAKTPVPGLIHSLEMSRDSMAIRILCAEARVNHTAVQSEMIADDEWDRICEAYKRIAGAPIFIDDTAVSSIRDIYRRVKELRRLNVKVGYVIVDYLQLIEPSRGSAASRVTGQEEVSAMSRALKILAKVLNIPVIVCAQLNRGPEQRTDKRPVLSDLRESGSVEQDADGVWLLFREDMYEREGPRAGEADIIVAKHRRGPTTTITVAFQGHYCRFVDMAA